MTVATVTDVSAVTPAPPHERVLPEPRGVFHDTWVVAKRGLIHMKRQPEALSDATVQPIMFVLLFGFVFGGAIGVPGGSYREFLMGGIFAQTIVFTAFGVAMAIATRTIRTMLMSDAAVPAFRNPTPLSAVAMK